MARLRRQRSCGDRRRPADDRRAQEPVARRPHRRGRRHGDRVGDAPVDGRGAGRAEADRGAALARGHPARAGLRLHPHVQRLRSGDRRTRAGAARAGRGRVRCLPGARGVPGRPLGGGAEQPALRVRKRPPRRGRDPALRRAWDHRCAPRHRRRLHASVHPRPAAGRARHARSRAARDRPRAPRRADAARAARHADGRADRGQGRPGRDSRRRARRPGSCRSASPAGSRARRAGSPSTAAPTSCWRGSSAPSIPTPTGTSSTPRGSRSSA